MDDKALRKLRRTDLLEILVAVTKENERLRARVAELEGERANWHLRTEDVGSLAEVAVQVTGLLQAAQATADLYVEGVCASHADSGTAHGPDATEGVAQKAGDEASGDEAESTSTAARDTGGDAGSDGANAGRGVSA